MVRYAGAAPPDPAAVARRPGPLTVLYVCLFLLIKKLEQFRTTIHCRCADMVKAAEKPGTRNASARAASRR